MYVYVIFQGSFSQLHHDLHVVRCYPDGLSAYMVDQNIVFAVHLSNFQSFL